MRFSQIKINRAGYTLVEMAIVIVIIGVLAAIVIPAFGGFLRSTRFQGAQNQLVTDIYFARSLAVARHRTFVIQFANNQYQVVDTSNGSVARTTNAPQGVTFAATADPNFYAWGLADPVDITLTGTAQASVFNLLPTGTVRHGS